jgi:hypothetical protein
LPTSDSIPSSIFITQAYHTISNTSLKYPLVLIIFKMVSFRNIFVAAAACAVPALAVLTPAQQVSGIQALTQEFTALQPQADKITTITGPLLVIGQGPFPPIIQGLSKFVQDASAFYSKQQGSAPVTKTADADAIYDAYRDVRGFRFKNRNFADSRLVRPCSVVVSQHAHRKVQAVQHPAHYRSARRRDPAPGREC